VLLLYRVVQRDGRRRIAIARLDASLRVVEPSVVPLSDFLIDGGDWHADPRFCVHNDDLLVHFNSGMPARGPNNIFLVPLDRASLRPAGPARALMLPVRQRVEKNWMLFSHGGHLYAVYQIAPHVVLRVGFDSRASGPVPCEPVHHVPWDAGQYTRRFGELRGSSTPVALDGTFFSFFHSTMPLAEPWRAIARRFVGRPAARRTYIGGFYSFAAAPPFAPIAFTPSPVIRAPQLAWRHSRALDPGVRRFVYPGGAIYRDGRWIVALGVQHEYCCLEIVAHDDLVAASAPCPPTVR
jgi:hypothetical protein